VATEQDLKNEIVYYLLHNRVAGSHKKSVDTVINHAAIASHDEGRAKDVIDEMLSDPSMPVEGYGGGSRQNVRLTTLRAGADYLEANDGEVPFGWE
jgi:hypothetical protein